MSLKGSKSSGGAFVPIYICVYKDYDTPMKPRRAYICTEQTELAAIIID
jgi:hypothetical protein